jgi:hypothetical protein
MSRHSSIEHNLNWIKWVNILKFHVGVLLTCCIMVLWNGSDRGCVWLYDDQGDASEPPSLDTVLDPTSLRPVPLFNDSFVFISDYMLWYIVNAGYTDRN